MSNFGITKFLANAAFKGREFFKTGAKEQAYMGFPIDNIQLLFYKRKDLERKGDETEEDATKKAEERVEKIYQTLQTFASNPTEEAQPSYPSEVAEIINKYQQLATDRSSQALTQEEFIFKQSNLNQTFNNFIDKSPAPLSGLVKAAGQKAAGKVAQGIASKAISALGVATGPLGKVLSFLATKFGPEVLSWLNKNIKYILAGIGGVIGFMALGFGGAIAGGAGGFVIGGALTGGVSGIQGAVSSVAGGAQALFVGLIGAVVGAIVAPATIALVGIPIAVALILFIINSGAYIVPSAPGVAGQPINSSIVASGSCPLLGSVRIGAASYNSATERGHGSNSYWTGGGACFFNIPIPAMYPGCTGPNFAGSEKNACYTKTGGCPYYGFAVDVVDLPSGHSPGADVALPYLCDAGQTSCPPLTWTLGPHYFNCAGQAVEGPDKCSTTGWGWLAIFTATGNGHTWKLDLNHVDFSVPLTSGQTFQSGTVIGKRSAYLNHVHIELDIDGVPVRPEFLCSGGTTGGTFPIGMEGWFIEAPIDSSNIVVSTKSEYGQKTCDWASTKNLVGSVNANFFRSQTDPVGPAGYNGIFTNYPTLSTTSPKVFAVDSSGKGRILLPSELPGDLSSYKAIVTGVDYNSLPNETRPRTALGVVGDKLLLVVVKEAFPSGIKSAMQALGAKYGKTGDASSWSFLLDGGSSTTMCQGTTPLFGNANSVSVSIGARSGAIKQLTR